MIVLPVPLGKLTPMSNVFSLGNPVGLSNDRTRPPDKKKLERNVTSINKAIKEKEASLVSYQLLAVSIIDSRDRVVCYVAVGVYIAVIYSGFLI